MDRNVIFNLLFMVSCCLAVHQTSPKNTKKQLTKRSYDCPPNFIRLGRKCYFFSQEQLPWQDAYYKCESLKSQMAVVKNSNQDKLIRTALSKVEPKDYWIGGRYNWHKKQWKWARSGKPLAYMGFDPLINYKDAESLKWSCILLDQQLYHRWGARSCLESKNFICHKKLKTVNRKERKNKKKPDELPVPANGFSDQNDLKQQNHLYQVEFNNNNNNDLGNDLYSYRSKRKNSRRNKSHRTQQTNHPSHSQLSHVGQYSNGTLYEQPKERAEEQKLRNLELSTVSQNSDSLRAYQLYKRMNRRNTSRIT